MIINWFGYYVGYDGYGRLNQRLVKALRKAELLVNDYWLSDRESLTIDWDNLSITCAPPDSIEPVPGRHWVYTMCEGTVLSPYWVDGLNNSGAELILVPSEHCVRAFVSSGVTIPVLRLMMGTDPDEFPVITERPERPYTFLTFCDRGDRKGWNEVWASFYDVFGGKTTGEQNVRLILKHLRQDTHLSLMAAADGADPRIIYDSTVYPEMKTLYSQADCLVLPSRSEGWGMPHREAACSGLPVITQQYSGMDDGNLIRWAQPLVSGRLTPIPPEKGIVLGEWMVADKKELSAYMKFVFNHPEDCRRAGLLGARWIREHQTWEHTAWNLLYLLQRMGIDGRVLERSTLPIPV
jgi:hypothetical protein